MKFWWSENHERLSSERAKIDELAENNQWLGNVEWTFDDQFNLEVVFEIKLPHKVFPLRLVYYNTFPNSCPSVRPLDSERLSGHQYGQSDLCLEIRPDNWVQAFTGADLIESAYNLLSIEQPAEDGSITPAGSAHNVSQNLDSRFSLRRFYLTELHLERLNNSPQVIDCKLWLKWCGEGFVIAYLKEGSGNGWKFENDNLPKTLGDESNVYSCIGIKTEVETRELLSITSKEQLTSLLDLDLKFNDTSNWYLLFSKNELPVLYNSPEGSEEIFQFKLILAPSEQFSRSGTDTSFLSSVKVGIVGLGSLGSKVAVSLARSGVNNFELVDDDIMHAGNLERHDCDWRDVGLHKVNAVARRIKLVSSKAVVSVRRVAIGSQISPAEMAAVNGALNECDLIIDATAEASVLNHLAAITTNSGGTLLWGGVYAGGVGGYIARTRDELDPTMHDIRQALNDYYDTIDIPPPLSSSISYDGIDQSKTLIAGDTDVSMLAGHFSKFALDSLLKSDNSNFDYPAYIIGIKKAWIFDSTFHVQPLMVKASARTKKCADVKDDEQQKFLEDTFRKKVDEITDRKKAH